MKAKLLAVLGLLTSGTIVGYIWGSHASSDATKPDTARSYLALYGPWKSIDSTHGNITLVTKSRIYSYTTGDKEVFSRERSAAEMLKAPMPERDLDKDFEKIMGLTVAETGGFSILSTLLESAQGEGKLATLSKGEKTAIFLATAGSAALGYWLGHKKTPDTSEPKFQETLTTEVAMWNRYEASWRTEYDNLVLERLVAVQLLKSNPADPLTRKFYEYEIAGKKCTGKSTPAKDVSPEQAAESLVLRMHPEVCSQVAADPRLIAKIQESPDS